MLRRLVQPFFVGRAFFVWSTKIEIEASYSMPENQRRSVAFQYRTSVQEAI
jgi:hypothetical protein